MKCWSSSTSTVSEAAVDALAQRLRLTRLESHTSNGITMFRWRIPDGRPVPEVIRSLRGLALVGATELPLHSCEQRSPADRAAVGGRVPQGEHWQYALAKLRLPQAHALAKGEKVLVAVIDSGIDTRPSRARGHGRGQLRCAQVRREGACARHRCRGRHRRPCPADGCCPGGSYPRGSGVQRQGKRPPRRPPTASSRASTGRSPVARTSSI